MDESLSDKAPQPEGPTVASPPFDRTDADIILRSSDNVDFRVFKLVLSLASPFFSSMFTLPQSSDTTSPEVIPVSEDSHILSILLAHCYPQDLPWPSTLDDAIRIWELCRKYEMAGIEARMRTVLARLISEFTEQEPIRAFALAVRHGLMNEARVAAKNVLSIPPVGRPYIPELEGITAGQYHRLEEYHHACALKALAVAKEPYTWIKTKSFSWFSCTSLFGNGKQDDYCQIKHVKLATQAAASAQANFTFLGGDTRASCWWVDYMQSCAFSLYKQPVGKIISMESTATGTALEKAHACPKCRDKAHKDMVEFVKLFSAEVDRAVSEVILNITL